MDMPLLKKRAFVTGGARGIGRCIAEAFCSAGATLVIADLDIEEATRTAQELSKGGAQVEAVEVDVTNHKSVVEMVSRVKQLLGGIDIAVNNAGICVNECAELMTAEQWEKVLKVNLTGVFFTAQAAGKQMIAQGTGGSIINIASMSAHVVNVPQPQCAYNASKAGVVQLTKSLAVEWCKYGIRVNSISPGYIGTDLTLSSPKLRPLIAEWERQSPMGRIGRPQELQGIAVYLAGETAGFTTGGDFVIDGAFTCI